MITLAMLVKDPPLDRLATLLALLAPVVGQVVVVVDDRTEDAGAILRMLPPNSYFRPFTWGDDFAAARNAALPYVTGDWTLWLDPDETPSPEMIAFLGFVDASSWADVEWVDRVHFAPRGYLFWRATPGLEDTQECEWHCRLFRTANGRWVRPIHEIILLDGRSEAELRETAMLPKAPRACSFDHAPVNSPEKAAMYEQLVDRARAAGWQI